MVSKGALPTPKTCSVPISGLCLTATWTSHISVGGNVLKWVNESKNGQWTYKLKTDGQNESINDSDLQFKGLVKFCRSTGTCDETKFTKILTIWKYEIQFNMNLQMS